MDGWPLRLLEGAPIFQADHRIDRFANVIHFEEMLGEIGRARTLAEKLQNLIDIFSVESHLGSGYWMGRSRPNLNSKRGRLRRLGSRTGAFAYFTAP